MAYKKGTYLFKIPLSPEEWEALKRKAEAQDRSAANYARQILLDGKINKKTK